MNVVVETLPNCLANVRVEVASDLISKTREQVVQKFLKEVRLPGFRPGKVPRAMVEKRFSKDIADELQTTVIDHTLDEAVREKKLSVLSVRSLDDVQWSDSKDLTYSATLITVPEFELPVYKGIPVTVPSEEVKEEEVDKSLEALRERHADFEDVTEDRGAALEDYVVVDYKGTHEGTPLSEAFPKLGKILSANEGFWIRMTEEAFFPGFCQNLVGSRVGETRSFQVDVPADFPLEDFAGKKVNYEVTLRGLKKRVLPELNDAFAGTLLEGKTLEDIRDLIRKELEMKRRAEIQSVKREAVLKALLDAVECELPEDMARAESNRVLREIVEENQQRGVSQEMLKENEKEIVSSASQTGRSRVKSSFIMMRIAEQENLRVEQNDMLNWVMNAARQHDMTEDRVIRNLRKRNGFSQVRSDILFAKAMDLVVSNAAVTVEGAAPEASA
jgi:trigger factor